MSRRARRASPLTKGLAAGEKLNRDRLPAGEDYSFWGWVGTEVQDVALITQEHQLATCGLSLTPSKPLCPNKFAQQAKGKLKVQPKSTVAGELEDDGIIVISSDCEDHVCTKKRCAKNPNCLNYLGQEVWENEDRALERFIQASRLGENPINNKRESSLPVGLKNLGATCYANAFLQVWFQDLAFRAGVYQCQPTRETQEKYEDSPIFQLQVTFAALQIGNQNVFNPIKLVESLQLRTSEQQDAQEFSKLFMSHLDSEFKKQSHPQLKSLIPHQFEGRLVYATVCENCKTRSERESNFLELEINLENNAKIEDRLSALLAPEGLTDDNKYLCSRCESLEDATRYTELRDIPPVLHISLLRFVYDVSTMARKKSKQSILFPPYLDMGRFLCEPDAVCSAGTENQSQPDCTKDIYELRGVLLHKGPSAYHGHYEAQVYDVTAKQWYQFNDETVTKMPSFHSKKTDNINAMDLGEGEKRGRAKRQTKSTNKRRIEDSEEEEELAQPGKLPTTYQYLISKDAYMLIYARCKPTDANNTSGAQLIPKRVATSEDRAMSISPPETPIHSSDSTTSSFPLPILSPPQRAVEVVASLNEASEEDCRKYDERLKCVEAKFSSARRMVLDIYRSWCLSSGEEDSVVLSRSALEGWLQHWFSSKRKEPQSEAKSQDSEGELPQLLMSKVIHAGPVRPSLERGHTIDNSEVYCHHGHLDPLKGGEMKRIRRAAYDAIIRESGCKFQPEPRPNDICKQCVEEEFLERLYQIEHPQLVAKFDAVFCVKDDHEGFWISKQWVKDWRLAKPKMHQRSRGDPPPDAPNYRQHIYCEHGGLALNPATRRIISYQAVRLIKALYPSWDPPPWDRELCAICDALVHISKEDKLEMRKKAENEKALLKRIYENEVIGRRAIPPNGTHCAVVASDFIRAWKAWLLRPGDAPRPDSVDNLQFVCEHGKLNFNPNDPSEFDNIAVISMEEWETVKTFYATGPLLTISIVIDIAHDGVTQNAVVTELSTCATCRHKKRLDYNSTHLSVVRLKADEPIPRETDAQPNLSTNGPSEGRLLISNLKQASGTRQSKRIRESRGRVSRIPVNKSTTVREMKAMLQKTLDIPAISQRLFCRGEALDHNEATVAELEILENDVLHLREVDDGDGGAILVSDADEPRLKRKREEGRAFGGTLLGGSGGNCVLPSPEPPQEKPFPVTSVTHPVACGTMTCPACTFDNDSDVDACAVCGTLMRCDM